MLGVVLNWVFCHCCQHQATVLKTSIQLKWSLVIRQVTDRKKPSLVEKAYYTMSNFAFFSSVHIFLIVRNDRKRETVLLMWRREHNVKWIQFQNCYSQGCVLSPKNHNQKVQVYMHIFISLFYIFLKHRRGGYVSWECERK